MMHITSGILITGLLTKTPENIKRLKRNMLYSLSPALLWHLFFFFYLDISNCKLLSQQDFLWGWRLKVSIMKKSWCFKAKKH